MNVRLSSEFIFLFVSCFFTGANIGLWVERSGGQAKWWYEATAVLTETLVGIQYLTYTHKPQLWLLLFFGLTSSSKAGNECTIAESHIIYRSRICPEKANIWLCKWDSITTANQWVTIHNLDKYCVKHRVHWTIQGGWITRGSQQRALQLSSSIGQVLMHWQKWEYGRVSGRRKGKERMQLLKRVLS